MIGKANISNKEKELLAGELLRQMNLLGLDGSSLYTPGENYQYKLIKLARKNSN